MRILISIGCNAYSHASTLHGAEGDATRIFDALIRPEIGDYDPAKSHLLLSPTLDELRAALRDALFEHGAIDTFTFFFAGHGGVRAGSFYMLTSDSKAEALSATAFSLSDLLLMLGDCSPAQSNIIIDACEAGGLISDLGVILKSEIMGNVGTPGITVVATSAQDQYANETAAGGVGTNAIMDCIEGRDFVQDSASALDLVEIGRRVSTRLRDEAGQNPVVWGLNLYGPPRFCRNVIYASDPAKPLRELLQSWPNGIDDNIRENYGRLWEAYSSAADDWNAAKFRDTNELVIGPLAATPEAFAGLLERLASSMSERAQLSSDPFRVVEVLAALAASVLPYTGEPAILAQALELQRQISLLATRAGEELVRDLEADRYALLAPGGLAELFYLPIRISKVLGWVAVGCEYKFNDDRDANAIEIYRRLLALILEYYPGSTVLMSDVQAPFVAQAFRQIRLNGLESEGEYLMGLLFSSLVDCGGRLARSDIDGSEAFKYCVARAEGRLAEARDLTERPCMTVSVVLRFAQLMGLSEAVDPGLWHLDGTSFLVYRNSNYTDFSSDLMSQGENLIWSIGSDVFRVEDLRTTWPSDLVQPELAIDGLIILASLTFPDRVPWHLLE